MADRMIVWVIFALIMVSCKEQTPKVTSSDGYELTPIGTSGLQKAVKKHDAGRIIEEGYFMHGLKFGQWVNYTEREGRVASVTSYIDGKRDGLYLKFDARENLNIRVGFKNDQYDGLYSEVQYGTVLKEANYKEGKLHGIYKEYYGNGKLLKEIEFKEDKQDGFYKYYDEQGNLSIEYLYKNGEKVSGGMLNK